MIGFHAQGGNPLAWHGELFYATLCHLWITLFIEFIHRLLNRVQSHYLCF